MTTHSELSKSNEEESSALTALTVDGVNICTPTTSTILLRWPRRAILLPRVMRGMVRAKKATVRWPRRVSRRRPIGWVDRPWPRGQIIPADRPSYNWREIFEKWCALIGIRHVAPAVSAYPGARGEGRRKRTPGTHCLRMRSISEESRKIGYFRNPPHNVDANFNNH